MKYSDFVENLADDLQEAFRVRERKIEVEIMEVSKPWGKELGISFSKGGIAHPILYPQKQYEYHEAGMNYFLMLNQMIDEIESAFSNVPEKFEFDPCTLKDTITIQLVNTERCRHYSGHTKVVEQENLLQQDFTATEINQKWCTDITYIHTLKDGWTYLASVMDFYSKKIIGWSYGTHMTADLALKAVENACLNVKSTEGIIINSDLGSQYTSDLFESYLSKAKMKHSFSRKGCPYDNACIESFHSLLKKEEVHLHTYIDSKDAYNSIFEYIESWYNRKRIHSSLNYMTPEAVHNMAPCAA